MPSQHVDRNFDKYDVSTVVSILPVLIDDSKPGLLPSQYVIQPVGNMDTEYAYLHVVRARFPVYLDENRPALIVPCPSDLVAESICRDYKVAQNRVEWGVSEPGLFWVPGKHGEDISKGEFKELLVDARRMQREWYRRLIEEADDDWTRYHMRRLITSMQRHAARALKEDREWVIEIKDPKAAGLTLCKFCKAEIHQDAIICRYCTGVLDVKAAEAAGFIKKVPA